MTTALTPEQTTLLRDAVDQKGLGKFTFLEAVSTDADRKLSVVTLFSNGDTHSAVVGIGDNSNWLTNHDQFKNVVKRAVDKLGNW
jgi:hypothetical protein